jgi:hypothetical protein
VGIERVTGEFSPVQFVPSLCKHVRSIRRDGVRNRYEHATWSPAATDPRGTGATRPVTASEQSARSVYKGGKDGTWLILRGTP